jgi:hypothetical protein
MTLQLYIDEDAMEKDLVRTLRARGVDVVTAWEAGIIERNDEAHLEYATAQGRSHAGIILARQQRYSVGEQMRRLLKLIAVTSAENMQNQVEFLSAWD